MELKNRILVEYIKRITFPRTNEARVYRQWVMELLTSTPTHKGGLGMGGISRQGLRDTSAQSNFRTKLENTSLKTILYNYLNLVVPIYISYIIRN